MGAAHYVSRPGTLATVTAIPLLLSLPANGEPWQHQFTGDAAKMFQALDVASSQVLADALIPSLYKAGVSFPATSVYSVRGAPPWGSVAPSSIYGWDELLELGKDWDGSGAAPVSRDAIRHAQEFLASTADNGPPFEPFAHPDGSVGLEAQNDRGAAYVLVSAENLFAYVIRRGDAVHRGNAVSASAMREVLALLY